MRVLLINRTTVLQFVLIFVIICVSMLYTVGIETGVLSVFMNNDKQIPIYCVDTEEKKIAISFDAAWGA